MTKNLICYCFGYSEKDIIRNVEENNGDSLILKRIYAEKKKGGCNCTANHPLGR